MSSEDIELPEDIVIPPPPHVYNANSSGDPRLIITHIVNHNFKSYSGKQVLGPFHKSFTAIVGPNGSGKSNVIDSMLFVFGYRANKIRSKKLSVLIHDSENAPKVSSCTVEVHFEKIVDLEDGGYCTVPNSSFSVSRRASKDNSSQYFIDKKKVLFKDVAELLQSNGIDLNHNRFLILQGEVEQIALMKPKSQNENNDGMLEFLEDIIGSSRYKSAIEKLNKEVEFFDEERKDKLSRVKVVEKDKDQLEPVHREAIEYLKKKNEITKFENKQTQYYIYKFTNDCNQIKEKIAEVKIKLKSSEEKLKEKEQERKIKAKELNKLAKSVEKCNEYHNQQKDRMRELENTNVKVFEERKYRKGKIKEMTKKKSQDEKKLENLKSSISKVTQDIEDNIQDKEVLQESKKEYEQKLKEAIQKLKPETQKLQDEKEDIEQKLLLEIKDVNAAKEKLDLSKVELQILISNLENAKEAYDKCNNEIKEASANEKDANVNLLEKQKLLTVLEKEVQKLNDNLFELKEKEASLGEKVEKSRAILAETKLNSQSNRSNSSVYKFLMQLKNSGKVSGIFGRLGDLAGIDDQYDVAISSCCPALENILVNNIETAQKCVKALKENDVGQATFIALDKMNKYSQHLRKDTPLPRLVDLVKPQEEKFRVAFYHALRDTLVSNDLISAQKVAFSKNRRWRVVTLKGEVIDTSGTMSGGGNKIVRGRMGKKHVNSVSSTQDLAQLQKTNDDLEEQLAEVQKNEIQCEESLMQVSSDMTKTKSTIKLLQQECSSQNSLLLGLKKRLPELKLAVQQAQPDPQVVKKCQSEVAKQEKAFESVSKNTVALEEEKKKIQEKIHQIGESRLKPIKDKLASDKQKLEEISKAITKQKSNLSTTNRNISKCEKSIEFIISELEQNAKEIESLEKQWKDLETEGAEVLGAISHAEEEKKKMTEELNEKQTELKQLESLDFACTESYKEDKQLAENLSCDLNGKHDKIKQWNEKLSKLKLHDVEDEEQTSLETYDEEQLLLVEEHELRERISVLDIELKNLQPNMKAIADYKEKQKIYLERVAQLDEVTSKRDNYRKLHDHLRKCRLNEFSEGFLVITNKLKEIYQMITLGGDAELEFVDSLDPFSEGIIFSVRPPKKSWKNICNLSGGEKTLSSLALVFALHHYRPTPLYVMDEIDAALDFKNVTIIAHYIVERTKNAQFIIISLRNNMFEVADRLVGIYKTDNCTKSATIEPSLIVANIEKNSQEQTSAAAS